MTHHTTGHGSNQSSSHRDGNNSSNRSSSRPMMSGWADTAKERPLATAAAVGGAVAAGVFLWSRRNQISDQLSHMSGQIGDWSENMRHSSSSDMSGRSSTPMGVESETRSEMAGAGTSSARSSTRATGGRSGKAQSGQTMSPARTANPTPGL